MACLRAAVHHWAVVIDLLEQRIQTLLVVCS